MRQSFDRATFQTGHTPHSGLSGQFVQQRLGVFKVRRVEALSEPLVNVRQYHARLLATTLVHEQPCQAGARAKFKRFRSDASRRFNRLGEALRRRRVLLLRCWPLGYARNRGEVGEHNKKW